MSIGMILLIIVGILILLGVGQRVLDKLRLNDKLALLFIALMIGLGFVPDIRVTDVFAFNLGGAVVPLALCVYLFIRADTGWERARSLLAARRASARSRRADAVRAWAMRSRAPRRASIPSPVSALVTSTGTPALR